MGLSISRRRTVSAALILATGLLVAACGGSGNSSDATAAAGGGPGDPAKATRTVEIKAGDDLRFQPSQVQAKVGETITFRVVNVANIEHDFVLGDEKAQSDHEKEMQQMSSDPNHNMAAMGDEPNAVHIPPGGTKDITWTFAKAGTVIYGCHEPGHYASGMKGTVTVS
jgi:uncharacterized cupredoxin-like copper-binding protein